MDTVDLVIVGGGPVGASLALGLENSGLSVVVPSALFARGMTSRLTRVNLGTAVAGFLLWELVKIGLTVAMLFMANWWIKAARPLRDSPIPTMPPLHTCMPAVRTCSKVLRRSW